MSLKCYVCQQEAAHFSDTGQVVVCDDCILSGKLKCIGMTRPDDPGIDTETLLASRRKVIQFPLSSSLPR